MVLYTTGYERSSIDEFVERLKQNGVTVLVDVRELPLSRKRGFSKIRIQQRLESENIEYVHIRELGSPRDMRHELRSSGNYEEFFTRYRRHLRSQDQALEQLEGIAQEKIVCIMCYEQEPHLCHRSVIVEELSDNGQLEVHHL